MSPSCCVEWTGVGGGEAAVEPVLVVQAGEKVLTGTQSWGGVGHGMEGNWGGFRFAAGLPAPASASPSPCPPFLHHQWGPGLAPGSFGVTWEVRCRLAGKVMLSA